MATYRITKTETIVYQRELDEEGMDALLAQAGLEASGRCNDCREHPGWSTADTARRRTEPADTCQTCNGSGVAPAGTIPHPDDVSDALDAQSRPWAYRYDWEWLERNGDVDGSTLVIERIEAE